MKWKDFLLCYNNKILQITEITKNCKEEREQSILTIKVLILSGIQIYIGILSLGKKSIQIYYDERYKICL
jgi:hypothetical protein